MELRFLGRETTGGQSPTLYATDQGSFVVQGWIVTDADILAMLDLAEDETLVEVYARLMTHLAKDGLGGEVAHEVYPIVHVRENGRYILRGKRVADTKALAQMRIPDHETAMRDTEGCHGRAGQRMMMETITFQGFQDIFRTSGRAFHLELRDDYHVEGEEVPFGKWLRGDPDDFEWRIEWLSFIKEVTMRGVVVERARVVTEPHTDYLRWELALDPQNIDAGEDIRYLPRRRAEGIVLPAEDCWLFDDDRLVLSLFKPEGGSGGFARAYDPDLIEQYRAVCNQVWSRAVPYAAYVMR